MYLRDTLSVAYKYSLIDEQLHVLPQNDEELATAYHAIFVCAALEICISLDRWTINGILFDAEHSYHEKSHIIFSVCSKYHLISGTDESFCLSSDLVKKMQRLTTSTWDWKTFAQKSIEVKDDQRFSIGEVTSNQLDDETLYSVVSILISMQKDAQGESHPVLNDHISPATMSETMDSELPEDPVQTYILTHFNASSKLQAIKY